MSLNLDRSTWKRVKLGDVVLRSRAQVDPVDGGVERYVAGGHVDTESVIINRSGDVSDGQMGSTFRYLFKPGHVLFVSASHYLRKSGVPDFAGVVADKTYVLEATPDNGLLQGFLPFLFKSDRFVDYATQEATGSMNPRLLWRAMQRYEFDLPPRDEQQRIADLLWALERHRWSVATIAARARDVDARALEVVSHADWPFKTVAGLGDVQLGQQLHPKYRSGPKMRKYLRVANVFDDELDLSDVATMDFSDAGAEKFRLRRGDILLNEGQSIELVGRCAMFRDEIEDCYMQKTLLRFRSGPEILPDFALAWFRRCYLAGEFSALAKRTTSMAHLTAVRFSAMPMPCPPLDVQRDLIARSATVKAATEALRTELAGLDSLHSSLMAATFGGD